jgi:DNA-binding NarL/FixJ family response regulator
MKHPCPMCGKGEDLYLDQINKKEHQKELMEAFLAGRKSERKFSKRENEIFDAYYNLEIYDFKQIAYNFNISESAAKTYLDRAMEKLTLLLINEKDL